MIGQRRESDGYPFVGDVLRNISNVRNAFLLHFSEEKTQELRGIREFAGNYCSQPGSILNIGQLYDKG